MLFNAGDAGSIPGSGKSPGEGNGYPLQYSCLENSMNSRAWWAIVHRVAKSWTRRSDLACTCMCMCVCVSVQSLSRVRLFATPWTAARQASLSITNSWSLLKLMSIESVMPCNHLILYRPFLLPPSIFPSIRVFSNESVLHIRWPSMEFQL